jgi:gliding motility-associated-like protein
LKKALIACFLILSGVAPLAAQTGSTFEFIENKGQWGKTSLFRADIAGSGFYLNRDGYTATLYNPKDYERVLSIVHGHFGFGGKAKPGLLYAPASPDSFIVRRHTYAVHFVGASPAPTVIPEKPIGGSNNYFIGNDPSRWASHCNLYESVLYKDLYPGIDVRYYSEAGRLKYDLIVHPGADLSRVRLRYDSVQGLRIRNTQLHIGTTVGESVEMTPAAYQPTDSGRNSVGCRYRISGNSLSFNMGDYDHSITLVIDPTFVFATFSGSKADNWGFSATYGADGSMYLGGIADAGYDTSPGAYQTSFKGEDNSGIPGDIAIIKLTADGKRRLFGTYIGGSLQDQPHSLIENPNGELVIAGRSNSGDFPQTVPNVGPNGGWDIIVCKLSSDGSQLLGSMKIGGKNNDGVNIADYSVQGTNILKQNYGDDARSEVNVDAAGNVYLASCTQSTDFPILGAGFQTQMGGSVTGAGGYTQDGVVLKINPAVNQVLWSTYLGGSGFDAAYVLALNPQAPGNLYVGGGTTSLDFPGVSAGVVQPRNAKGTCDGFVAWLVDGGNTVTLNRATYIGTGGIDQVYGLKFDKLGFPYIMGTTTGTWTVVNAPYNTPGSKQFIAKLEPDLSTYVYSTCFGTATTVPNISPVAFLVDRCENVYVSGWGGKTNKAEGYLSSGTLGLPITSNAYQSRTDGNNFYFFVMEKNAASQLYGSFFGQIGGAFADHVDGGTSRFDQNGVIYQGICANCGGGAIFPTGPADVWSFTNPSNGRCNEVGVKIAFNLAGVGSGVKAAIAGRPPYIHGGCVPMQVNFTDTIGNAVSFIWRFGDGSPDVTTSVPQTAHTYTQTGTFNVRLISVDSNSCNVSDTSYVTLTGGNNEAIVNYSYAKLPPCESLIYRFYNHSAPSGGLAFSDSSFVWNFGDGTPPVVQGTDSITHNFPAAGTYSVTLTMIDTNFCNYPQTDTVALNISPLVKAGFRTPLAGCAPYEAVFNTIVLGGQQFIWTFGDGSGSTEEMPVHLYPKPGVYTIRLKVIDSSTCNIADSTSQTITVSGSPSAAFTWGPNPSAQNTPTVFTNGSSADAIRFEWLFGDQDSLVTASRDTVAHQYNISGTFNACLAAYNASGCSDTACSPITALVLPLLDVPNAFTPGRFGQNSLIRVKGFGIEKMDWKIYNRWGQLVFESINPDVGWDGSFKGILQPMDVYAFTLSAEFTNGAHTTKTGDITLLR